MRISPPPGYRFARSSCDFPHQEQYSASRSIQWKQTGHCFSGERGAFSSSAVSSHASSSYFQSFLRIRSDLSSGYADVPVFIGQGAPKIRGKERPAGTPFPRLSVAR